MPDLLDQGSDFLERTRHAHMASAFTYSRPSAASEVEVRATVGRSEFQLVGEDGGSLQVESRDYLILVSELVLDGQAVTPLAGDLITDENGLRYEVLPSGFSGTGEPSWRYSDLYRRTFRIHTKAIGEAA